MMRANRREGGRAEELLRSALWRRGLRFRKHVRLLPGKPDVVFAKGRLCVFCDGDFWHGRDWPRLRARLRGRANAEYWIPKIARNRERDVGQVAALRAAGWRVVRLWESSVLRNPDGVVDKIEEILSRLDSRA